ncbi:uncharacterized protein BKCO1_8000124 [Diplodia corticola]|uniref:Uncharacterized protein n=1 Tax=Diplodia corticola TaxID=236234 RepID=A0A1J9SBS6_9PEZI|nr:uncharacterized protein BKCO1_8000124 [Diplodia corticola]OJD37037.1 hypothetical protein BKCO1_8000124 [Diplodia corticola]
MPPPCPNEAGPPAFFFDAFPDYTFRASATVRTNFKALAAQRGWATGSKRWRRQWRACFGRAYAQDDDDDAFDSGGFAPDPTAPLEHEFGRMALHEGFGRRDKGYAARRAPRALLRPAKLCRIVDVPVGSSITQCKKELKDHGVMINLVNLMNHMRSLPREDRLDNLGSLEPCKEVKLVKFENWKSFRSYTKKHTFPRNAAKANGFINTLLRKI